MERNMRKLSPEHPVRRRLAGGMTFLTNKRDGCNEDNDFAAMKCRDKR